MKIQNTFRVLAVLKACSLFGPIPPLLSHFFYICSSSTSTKLGTYIFLTILRDLLFTAVENFAYFPRLGLFKPSLMRLQLTAHHRTRRPRTEASRSHPYQAMIYCTLQLHLWLNTINIIYMLHQFSVRTYKVLKKHLEKNRKR